MNAPTADLTRLIREIERRAVVEALRRHHAWRLSDLHVRMRRRDRFAEYLRTVTLAELRAPPLHIDLTLGGQRRRLARARGLTGDAFDEIVLEVVTEAGRPVPSGYVKARTGGPRWKLQHSLGRLVEAGRLERLGITSATRYRPVGTGDP